MASIVPYSDKFRAEVIAVLKRNFAWMSRYSDEYIYNWLRPIIAYHWTDDVSLADVPYKYGAVLLDGDNVVGFFGTVYSYRYYEGKKYLYLTFSTWCADVPYRMNIFSAIRTLCDTADIICDFTPNAPSREIAVKMFGFKYVNDSTLIFRPVPFLSRNKVTLKFIHDPSELQDNEQRIIFTDHKPYGVKCAEFERNGEKGCIFYYLYKCRRWKRRIPWFRQVRTVKIFNSRLFTENLHEIVRKIQKHEGYFVQFWLEKTFLDGSFSHYLYSRKQVHRLIKTNKPVDIKPDLLYSELAILNI